MITSGGKANGPDEAATVIFPDHAGPAGAPFTPIPASPKRFKGEARDTTLHVLMVEDDPAIAEMYRVQLEHDGYRVSLATTGEVAFSTLFGSEPDLVLLDLLLPDRSGFEVLAALNERLPNHPPVVILSNYGEPSMIDRGRALGAVEYLVKSRVTPAQISEQIPTWIGQRRRRGQGDS